MYAVTKVIRFCYGHRLLDYRGKCRYLHGHNGKVEIELGSLVLDRRGMVRDFEEIKRTVQRWIDTTLDHTMLLRRDDPLAPILRRRRERCVLLDTNPTAEAIAKLIFDYCVRLRFPVTAVRLWETEHSVATYRASTPASFDSLRSSLDPARDPSSRDPEPVEGLRTGPERSRVT